MTAETQEEEYNRKFSELRISIESKDRKRRIPVISYPDRIIGLKRIADSLRPLLLWLRKAGQLRGNSRGVILSSVCTARSKVTPDGEICAWSAEIWLSWEFIDEPEVTVAWYVIDEALTIYREWWGDE